MVICGWKQQLFTGQKLKQLVYYPNRGGSGSRANPLRPNLERRQRGAAAVRLQTRTLHVG
jgi:hypothetical protein